MSEADRERWNDRYSGDDLVMGEGPNALAAAFANALPREGRALEIACGEGGLAVWLAKRGLFVDAIDIAANGLAKLRREALAAGVGDRVRGIEHDLDHGLPPLPGGYVLATCFHFYAPSLFPAIRERLAPGGMLLVEVRSRAGAAPGEAPVDRYRAAPGEVLGWAGDLAVHFFREGRIRGKGQAQLLAQRPPLVDVR
jgi:SAM-dependent methyltransferase